MTEGLVLAPDAKVFVGNPYGPGYQYGWKDLVGNVIVKGVGANDPTWAAITGLGGMFAYRFSATALNEVWLQFHIDHDYAPNTPVYLHTHWLNSAATPNTGVVRWGFEVTYAKGHQQEAFPAPSTYYVNQTCSATRYLHHIAEISDADAAAIIPAEPDTILLVRCFRDAADPADTCTDAVHLLTMDCHYQTDRFATLNKAPDFNEYP